MIIGICGRAGSGKDTVGDYLVEKQGFVKIALADPLKRICREVFDFTDEQLWGPSARRNEEDRRYVHLAKGSLGSTSTDWNEEKQTMNTVPSPPEDVYLTPRHALQQLGTEWGRECYKNVWVDYGLRLAKQLLEGKPPLFARYEYSPKEGLIEKSRARLPHPGVVISDIRFKNEVEAIAKAGGQVWKLERPGLAALEGAAGEHQSETEQDGIDPELFAQTVVNDGTLEDLNKAIRKAFRASLKTE